MSRYMSACECAIHMGLSRIQRMSAKRTNSEMAWPKIEAISGAPVCGGFSLYFVNKHRDSMGERTQIHHIEQMSTRRGYSALVEFTERSSACPAAASGEEVSPCSCDVI